MDQKQNEDHGNRYNQYRFERSQDRMQQEDPRIEDARGLKMSVD